MLAEPKSKKTWILNPRVNAWSSDETKYGQRLLVDMGWQKGKGLGKNLTGLVDNVRLRTQCDSKGLGYEGVGEEWISHQDDFNSILAGLQQQQTPTSSEGRVAVTGTDDGVRVASLEQTSKKSRARVHYHKFTRGKDLSRYSSADIASILGGTSRATGSPTAAGSSCESTSSVVEPTRKDPLASECVETTTQRSAPQFKSTVSVQDYFAAKMARLKARRLAVQCVDPPQDETAVDSVQDNLQTQQEPPLEDTPATKKPKKKRKHAVDVVEAVEDSSAYDTPKKIKKTSSKRCVDEHITSQTNAGSEPGSLNAEPCITGSEPGSLHAELDIAGSEPGSLKTDLTTGPTERRRSECLQNAELEEIQTAVVSVKRKKKSKRCPS